MFDSTTTCDCTKCDSCTSDGKSDSNRCNEFDHSCNCTSIPQKADLTPAAVTVNNRPILNCIFYAPIICLASFYDQIETVPVVNKQFVLLSINQSDYLAVIGHSGSGKTTMLNIIGCLDHPSSGQVMIEGASIAGANEKLLTTLRKNTIGFVFQQFFLIPTLTVLQNVALPSLFTGKNSLKKAEELLVHVGLKERLRHIPSQLSGGEMQRVAIARSLINNPKVLLADEPTGNLLCRR